LVGGLVIDARGWRWTQWTALFFTAASLLSILVLKETYKRAVLKTRAKRLRVDGPPGGSGVLSVEIRKFMTSTILRPAHMLFTEPIVGCLCAYAAFNFGLIYIFVVASPAAYEETYGFDLVERGLSFAGFLIGTVVAPIPVIALDHFIYRPRLERAKGRSHSAELPPEQRLHASMLGSILLPLGLFWYGWTMRPDIHWVCPIAAQGVAIAGSLQVYIVANLYMMDTYGPLFGASAQGANSLTRYTVSAAAPLFALQMFRGLGIAWAASLLGFCSLLMAPIPWILFRYGPQIRTRSKYPAGD